MQMVRRVGTLQLLTQQNRVGKLLHRLLNLVVKSNAILVASTSLKPVAVLTPLELIVLTNLLVYREQDI